MLRKFALGFVAAVALGIAAFSPTSASASDNGPRFRGGYDAAPHQNFHGRDHFRMHRGWHGAHAHFRHRGCLQERLVPTPWGPRYRMVNVCRH